MGGYSTGNIHEGEVILNYRSRLPISTTSSVTSTRLLQNNSPESATGASSNQVVPTDILPLVHKWSHSHSILSVILTPTKGLVICGTQDAKILIFDVTNFSLVHTIQCGHNQYAASVLCLCLSDDENYLFSAGSDSLVRIWDLSPLSDKSASTYSIRCTHIVYSLVDIGDIFSISWSGKLSTLFIGAQNASILWSKIPLNARSNDSCAYEKLPHIRFDKFFDSFGPGGALTVTQSENKLLRSSSHSAETGHTLIEVNLADIVRFAHNGYVYCMEMLNNKNAAEFCDLHLGEYDIFLASCGGEGMIKIWGLTEKDGKMTMKTIATLENEESVLSIFVIDLSVYVGLCESSVNAWDLTTFQLTRSFRFPSPTQRGDEVLSLCIYDGFMYKATDAGGLCKFILTPDSLRESDTETSSSHLITKDFDTNYFFEQEGNNLESNPVFAVHTFRFAGSTYLLSGGQGSLCLWNISMSGDENTKVDHKTALSGTDLGNDLLLESLRELLTYKTISKYPGLYLEESRKCAKYLSSLMIMLGASSTKLLPVPNCNPVVYARFERSHKFTHELTRVLWYGHYDVVEAAQSKEFWDLDPFKMTANNGNLYARGVSDNKGPTLAAIYAVAQLHRLGELSTDVVFMIEGEEECGSIGFQDIVTQNKGLIGNIDWIMFSNSYWLDDTIPCLNYGLRGVINASVSISSEKPDRHSGVDGGVSKEPTMDLVQLLGTLVDPITNRIQIEGFYDDVLPMQDEELRYYKQLRNHELFASDEDFDALICKWRNPSLTVHRIEVSGPRNNTVISQTAHASISIRVVPNQQLGKVKASLIGHLEKVFESYGLSNKLAISIFHEAEPWLGDVRNTVYKLLYDKIKLNWGPSVPDPIFVREGGSIPSIRFLEREFDAPAAQIPCGQASDNAHLKNEKLRVLNLYKLRSILTDSFGELGKHK